MLADSVATSLPAWVRLELLRALSTRLDAVRLPPDCVTAPDVPVAVSVAGPPTATVPALWVIVPVEAVTDRLPPTVAGPSATAVPLSVALPVTDSVPRL